MTSPVLDVENGLVVSPRSQVKMLAVGLVTNFGTYNLLEQSLGHVDQL